MHQKMASLRSNGPFVTIAVAPALKHVSMLPFASNVQMAESAKPSFAVLNAPSRTESS